jgi:hypothetical protein
MTTATAHLVEEYLDRLEGELRDLSRARRRELVDEIGEHIAAARAELAPGDEAGLRTVLDQLGDPADIAAEARERFGVQPRRGGALEVVALILVLLGGAIIPVLGWLAGVALLWASRAWTVRDKLIGTLVPPGGLASVFFVYFLAGSFRKCDARVVDPASHETVLRCHGGTSGPAGLLLTALLVVLTVAPFVTTVYLARRMRSQRSAH